MLVLVSRLGAAGRLYGLRGLAARRSDQGGRCRTHPPHKGSRLRLTAPKKESGERSAEYANRLGRGRYVHAVKLILVGRRTMSARSCLGMFCKRPDVYGRTR